MMIWPLFIGVMTIISANFVLHATGPLWQLLAYALLSMLEDKHVK